MMDPNPNGAHAKPNDLTFQGAPQGAPLPWSWSLRKRPNPDDPNDVVVVVDVASINAGVRVFATPDQLLGLRDAITDACSGLTIATEMP